MCVAWIRHQRSSTATLSSSHCTGRAPSDAMQSSTSFCCSAAWMCTGIAASRSSRSSSRRCSSSGATARSECGATPRRCIGLLAKRRADRVEHPRELLGVGDETALAGGRREPAEIAVGIENRQQRQPDAGAVGCGTNPFRHLDRVGVRLARGIVMQVVKFGHRRVAGFQHFDVKPGRDRFHVVRRQSRQKAIHQLPPRPEAVAFGTGPLRKPGHRPLEGVRVQVRHAGNDRAVQAFGSDVGHVRRDAGDHAVVADDDQHVVGPARRQHRAGSEVPSRHRKSISRSRKATSRRLLR